jgi:hypothetical protein
VAYVPSPVAVHARIRAARLVPRSHSINASVKTDKAPSTSPETVNGAYSCSSHVERPATLRRERPGPGCTRHYLGCYDARFALSRQPVHLSGGGIESYEPDLGGLGCRAIRNIGRIHARSSRRSNYWNRHWRELGNHQGRGDLA